MSDERSTLVSNLVSDFDTRAAYINAKVSTLVPAQIRGLRLKSETPRQPDLGRASKMHQSRISMLETAGANPTIGTLSQIAAGLKVGLKIEFVSFSEMLAWENNFSQDEFDIVPLDEDTEFINPQPMVPLAATLKSYQWRDVGQGGWPEENVAFLCIPHHGGTTFSTMGGDFWFNYEQPQDATGPAVSGEVGPTVFLPAIHSLALEGIR